jgi:ketosteroid isomerase-like protein
MARREIELLRNLYARWARGDFRGGRELLDPDVEFNLGTPDYETTPAHGPDQVEQQMREFLANWADYRVEAEEFLDAGDSVLVRARQRGLGKYSGVEVDMPLVGVWTFRGAKAVRISFYSSEEEAREAAGMSRPRARRSSGSSRRGR